MIAVDETGEKARAAAGYMIARLRKAPAALPTAPRWMKDISTVAKKNAKTRGIVYDLTREDLTTLTERCGGKCEVTGLQFQYQLLGRGKRNPYRPSLDRIENDKGYILSNVRVVSNITNMAMNEWGEEPLLVMARALCRKADNDHRHP